MKTIKQRLIVLALASIPFASCVDDLKFGNAFLEKAPGGTVTRDTIFNNAEYTRQFLTGIYTYQYYGLQYHNSRSTPTMSDWTGKFEALSDLWSQSWTTDGVVKAYYYGTHSAGYSGNTEKYNYLRANMWEVVRWSYLLLENIEEVPGLDTAEKERMKAEAKCLIAAGYFDMFRHYGGIPILRASFSGTEDSYEVPRSTVEETVDFIVGLLDEAAAVLPWRVANPAVETGRWTKAGAMGLKTSVLLFAASPLFNSDAPYAAGEAAEARLVWYGGYKPELWDRALNACDDFFRELNANGQHMLVQAVGTRPQDYRLAFRKAYFQLTSPEVLHSVRVATHDTFGSYYRWHNIAKNNGRGYNGTQEYVEMFPWADGTPFDWNKEEAAGTLYRMFIEQTANPETDVTLTRDPRLYESVLVNGMPRSMDWNTGNMSGQPYEAFLNGYDAKLAPTPGTFAMWSTGYKLQKYYLEEDALRQDTHWSYLRLAEVYLIYAEVLCQTGQLQAAIDQVDIIRARVGLKGLVESMPDKNLTGNKEVLLAEILLERARELGMEDSRFFDLIRYKRADIFEKQLHGLLITRKDGGGAWYGGDRGRNPWPEFNYERVPITNPARVWWNGFDPKWYLSPFPLSEMNKGYGLVQNPGW